jgi:hypothetical protein
MKSIWNWLLSPRTSSRRVTMVALLLLGFMALVHIDLFLRTVRSQTVLSMALSFNVFVFIIAIVTILRHTSQIGWVFGAAGAFGAATAWLLTELFPAFAFMDPEGAPWQGNLILHLLTAHVKNTGNVTFLAELTFIILWITTTRDCPLAVKRLRRAALVAVVILLSGFVAVMIHGGGVGNT